MARGMVASPRDEHVATPSLFSHFNGGTRAATGTGAGRRLKTLEDRSWEALKFDAAWWRRASREGGVRAAPRCCPPTVISLWYSSLFDDNRLQTPALSALCEGEGLRTIVLRTSVYANPTNGFNISYRPLDRAARCHPRASPS